MPFLLIRYGSSFKILTVCHTLFIGFFSTFLTQITIYWQNFIKFREYFFAEYKAGFICPANSFDNVKGNFPIGFLIWDLSSKKSITKITTDIFSYDEDISQYRKTMPTN
jgi:hypothetical protein